MNANNFWKAFGPVCGEQLHSSLMGVNVKAGSTFSRGTEWRECCVPARQEVGGGGGLGRGACVETEGRSPGRRAARPDRRRRENEDESRRSFKFIVPAFRPFLRLPRRLCRHLISGMNSNQRILFFKGGRGGTLTELLVRRQSEENSNNPKECK